MSCAQHHTEGLPIVLELELLKPSASVERLRDQAGKGNLGAIGMMHGVLRHLCSPRKAQSSPAALQGRHDARVTRHRPAQNRDTKVSSSFLAGQDRVE